jgi:hypothetical protein
MRSGDLINPPQRRPARDDAQRSRLRALLLAGSDAAVVLLLMVGGSVVLWVGVPVGTLWIGGHVQGSSGSVATAIVVMFWAAITAIALIIWALVRLDRKHAQLRAARGHEGPGPSALEAVLAVSATLAVVGYGFWLLIIEGPGSLLTPGA